MDTVSHSKECAICFGKKKTWNLVLSHAELTFGQLPFFYVQSTEIGSCSLLTLNNFFPSTFQQTFKICFLTRTLVKTL